MPAYALLVDGLRMVCKRETRGTGASARNEVPCACRGVKVLVREPRRHLIRATDSGHYG